MVNLMEARELAVKAHGEQKYGDFPYSIHLDAVAKLASPYGETAFMVAYLHDVVEDTDVTTQQVKDKFGALAAECVALLTDEPGESRKERKAKTYAKLEKVSGQAEVSLIVKAADRLANVRACVADVKRHMWEIYKGEHPVFRKAAFREGLCPGLWQELDALLISWPTR